jgi:hypothetical protein
MESALDKKRTTIHVCESPFRVDACAPLGKSYIVGLITAKRFINVMAKRRYGPENAAHKNPKAA